MQLERSDCVVDNFLSNYIKWPKTVESFLLLNENSGYITKFDQIILPPTFADEQEIFIS